MNTKSGIIIDFLTTLRNNSRINLLDELKTKQLIISRMLDLLNWDIFNIDEVSQEYLIEKRRVDYSLRLNKMNKIFIEVKKIHEELDKLNYQEQLLDYSFRQGVELAILTNGLTWWFYLPLKKGDWKTRKFYAIDIIEHDSNDASIKFINLLLKDNVYSGKSLQYAEQIYKEKREKKIIKETLPEAWNKIIKENASLLIELISETTEKICGFKPDGSDVKDFLKSQGDIFVIRPIESPRIIKVERPLETKIREPKEDISIKWYTLDELRSISVIGRRPNKLKINDHEYIVSNWTDTCLKIVGWLINNNYLTSDKLPVFNSAQKDKYFINSEPSHLIKEKDAEWHEIGTFYIDTKYNADAHIKNLIFALDYLDVKRSIILISI